MTGAAVSRASFGGLLLQEERCPLGDHRVRPRVPTPRGLRTDPPGEQKFLRSTFALGEAICETSKARAITRHVGFSRGTSRWLRALSRGPRWSAADNSSLSERERARTILCVDFSFLLCFYSPFTRINDALGPSPLSAILPRTCRPLALQASRRSRSSRSAERLLAVGSRTPPALVRSRFDRRPRLRALPHGR